MRYTVVFKPSAHKALLKLDRVIQRQLIEAADTLADDPRPHGVEKLSGEHNLWRIRVRDWRMVYEIQDRQLVVLVLKVGHRRDIYRR
ncbi:MAG: type II toxin-antitoxin system RelE/ParE family toxin [Phycisphaerales bacterium]|jgi:mRNA interferase RelE/StbE|nr:type II toxin-antitoxin system RelE/ParE family toxin [Phycisphaerales bacterium]